MLPLNTSDPLLLVGEVGVEPTIPFGTQGFEACCVSRCATRPELVVSPRHELGTAASEATVISSFTTRPFVLVPRRGIQPRFLRLEGAGPAQRAGQDWRAR